MEGTEADEAMATQGDAHYVGEGGNKDTAVMPCGQVVGLVDEIRNVDGLISDMVYGARTLAGTLAALTSGDTV
jgi:NAD(P)H-dependent flavin oxidoreductase YrpB (nitropropane dioxygenase family)